MINKISNLIMEIGNNLVPLPYLFIISGIIIGLCSGINSLLKMKNRLIAASLEPKVKKIKSMGWAEDKVNEELRKLYDETGYSVILPGIFNAIIIIFTPLFVISVFSIARNGQDLYMGSKSFLGYNNIFERQFSPYVPIIIAVLDSLPNFLFLRKEMLNTKKTITSLVTSLIVNFLVYGLLPPSIILYMMGRTISRTITGLAGNLKRNEIYEDLEAEIKSGDVDIKTTEKNRIDIMKEGYRAIDSVFESIFAIDKEKDERFKDYHKKNNKNNKNNKK